MKYGDSLYNNTRKSLDIMLNETAKDKSILSQSINEFGRSYDGFMIRFKNILKWKKE